MATIPLRARLDIPASIIGDIDAAVRRNMGPVATAIGNDIVKEAKLLAKARLVTGRPESRRSTGVVTAAGRAPKGTPHYIDSFVVGAPDLSGGRVRVVVYNSHPAALIIEHGTGKKDYPIHGPGSFPIVTTKAGGGDYANNSGKRRVYGGARGPVIHPGTDGYHIIEDARDAVKANTRKIKMKVNAFLKS